MPKVRFLSTQTPNTGRPNPPTYEEGKTYDLPQTSVRHWLNRGAIEVVGEEPAKKKAPPPEPGTAETRAARGVDLDDPGTGAPPPDAMTTDDMPKPRRPQDAPEKAAVAPADDLEGKTNKQLRDIATSKGLDLGTGYVPNDELVAALRKAK